MKIKLTRAVALGLLLLGSGSNQAQAGAPAAPQGLISEEIYLDIGSGVTIPDLTASAKYTNGTPDQVNYRKYFEYQGGGDITVAAPSDVFGNSGARMAGYFYPPVTGDYTFYIAADDAGQLFLSTDDNPANKKLIASEAGWSGNRSYTAMGGGSVVADKNSSTYAATAWPTKDAGTGGAKITLTQGKAYYIEALEKEGGGGDDLSVAVQDPNGVIDATVPIPGAYLSSLKSTGPVTFLAQPKSQTVDELGTVTFSVNPDGTPPYTFQWTRNGANITDATNSSYTISRVTINDNGIKFACKVTGAAGAATSADGVLTVNLDKTVPTVVSTTGSSDLASVVVMFSKPMDTVSAQAAANYTIAGLTVSKAVLSSGDKVVTLTTSSQTEGTTYALKINGVKDQTGSGNPLAANTTVNFTAFKFVTGTVVIKYYDSGNPGIAGVANVVATQTPTRTDVRSDAQSASWENGSNYAALLEGLFAAPETGDYVFYIASDDQSQLFLSTDATVANLSATPVAQVTGWTNQREWTKEEGQNSGNTVAISLVKGKKYFLRAYQVEGTGGDGIAIGWITPTMANDGATAPVVVPGSAFVLGVNPDNSSVTITKQPASVTGTDGKFVTFTVAATGKSDVGSVVTYQWQKNGQNITGATGTSYTPARLTLADSGTKYQCVVSVPAKDVTTDAAVLTVIADTVPPVVMGVGALKSPVGWDAGVMFDEPVDLASAGVLGNYSLSGGTITGVTVYTNTVDMPGVVLAVTGLTVGSKYTLTVKNVADIKGNKISTASKEFTVTKFGWGAVGADEMGLGLGAGYGVVPVAENGFDLYSDGIGEWGTYDEATFVYEQITGNFDKSLRVEYQDLSSQWARAGLIARDVTNFGVNRADQEAGAAGRYQKVHVNPQGPTMTGPGTAGNNAWEGNRRLDTGAATTSASAYNGANPKYPNAWCRIVREGQTLSIYRSDDGQAWTLLGITDWAHASTGGALPDTLFVGPEFSPENGNVTDTASRGRWLAQIRDYGDTKALTSTDATAAKRKVVFLGNAKFTADKGGHTGQAGDYAMDNGTLGNAMAQVADPTFLNAPAANDELSFSVWVKRYDINDSSAFWVRSRQGSTADGGNSDRAFQAHTPWSDNNIVFDTVGCCDTTTQRISASASTASGYTGLDWWTNNWHHLVFTKKADQKNVYIDGVLFLNGSSSNPLPTDIGEMMIGAETGTANSMHAKIDDFAIFGKELTVAQVKSLSTGAAPSSISGAQLLAFWNFNDAPITTVVTPTVSAAKGANGLVITFTGTLQSATSINGPWTDETATGSITVPFTGTAKFFRAKQ